jgi:putative flavoprotein involved in K+ transport
MQHIETVVVGGGQAGLATSYWLAQAGREHVVLEQASHPAEAWRSGRWDSFTLVSPNWMTSLPGAEYAGDDPEGFMPAPEVVEYFDRYVAGFGLPVQAGTRVSAVERDGSRYLVHAGAGDLAADNVVVATGIFQRPKIPAYSVDLPAEITQLHSSAYRSPDALPPGAVVVVGSGQSGSQIAEELHEHERKVYLCVGNAPRAPRCYRGKDVMTWLAEMGFFDQTVDQLPSPAARFMVPPHLSGRDGGHTINLHAFAREGIVLLGHLQGVHDGKLYLAPDLRESLARIDQFEVEMLKRIDGYIARRGLQAPAADVPRLDDGNHADIIRELDLKAAGITVVIWATGYTFDFDLVKLPILDAAGFPVQLSGETAYPGLYFVGLPWLPKLKSAFLFGVGENAEHVASQIVSRSHVSG